MSNGILPLPNEILQILSLKHSEAQQAHNEAILQDPKSKYEVLFMKTSMKI